MTAVYSGKWVPTFGAKLPPPRSTRQETEEADFSETSVPICYAVRCHILNGSNPQQKLKSSTRGSTCAVTDCTVWFSILSRALKPAKPWLHCFTSSDGPPHAAAIRNCIFPHNVRVLYDASDHLPAQNRKLFISQVARTNTELARVKFKQISVFWGLLSWQYKQTSQPAQSPHSGAAEHSSLLGYDAV
jgi:hypothetical protein